MADKEQSPLSIAGMTPFMCDYTGPDGRPYSITLHGTSEAQILEDHCDTLPDLKIVGVAWEIIPCDNDSIGGWEDG